VNTTLEENVCGSDCVALDINTCGDVCPFNYKANEVSSLCELLDCELRTPVLDASLVCGELPCFYSNNICVSECLERQTSDEKGVCIGNNSKGGFSTLYIILIIAGAVAVILVIVVVVICVIYFKQKKNNKRELSWEKSSIQEDLTVCFFFTLVFFLFFLRNP
jgi:hypothetical protein